MPIVVIDPGHGGDVEIGGSSANNAEGPSGLLEKTVTLDLALRVRSALNGSTIDVRLTRTTDTNLSLKDRANVARNGVLDTKHYSRFGERSWSFRSVGYGQGEKFWRDFVSALRMVGYDGVLSIEHEDGMASVEEGLSKAVEVLRAVVLRESPAEMWWA